jgi:monoamine oxidase
VGTYPTFVDGDNLLVRDGRCHRYRGLIPRGLSWWDVAVLGVAMKRIDVLARTIPLDEPWFGVNAEAWDRRTVASWVDSRWNVPSRAARALLRTTATEIFATDPSEVSLLHLLFHLNSAGGFASQTSIEGGVQQDRIAGGMQAMANAIATRLGEALRLGAPVRTIRRRDDGVEVAADGVTVHASRVIVAVPPVLAGQITYEPALPATISCCCDACPPASRGSSRSSTTTRSGVATDSAANRWRSTRRCPSRSTGAGRRRRRAS